jgi:hypothetical protein
MMVTLAVPGVAAALVSIGLVHRLTRDVARFPGRVERFAAALTGCPTVAATSRRTSAGGSS